MRLRTLGALATLVALVVVHPLAAEAGPVPAAQATPPAQVDLPTAIGNLGSLDYDTRTNAARAIRRVPAPTAVAALDDAARRHSDGYVRYRALILLAGFSDELAAPLMRAAITDRNDRLRQVAYNYYEHRPDPAVLPVLLQALDREESEFVRPALVRALAAQGGDPRVRESLLVEVDRGVDFFRSAVIEALGDFDAAYATSPLIRIAQQEGPLQDDALLALGKIGSQRALEPLVGLQRGADRILQPAIAAAICLLGVNCDGHRRYLDETLRFAEQNVGFQDLLRAAAAGLGALASTGDTGALGTLFDVGIASDDPARAPIALAVGLVALRNTDVLLAALEAEPGRDGALLLVRDAFDMLNEDFEEERFFVTIRGTFWQAPEGSARREVAERLVQTLEF